MGKKDRTAFEIDEELCGAMTSVIKAKIADPAVRAEVDADLDGKQQNRLNSLLSK
jgi:hypothetical protein